MGLIYTAIVMLCRLVCLLYFRYRFHNFRSLSMYFWLNSFVFEFTGISMSFSFPTISYRFRFRENNVKLKMIWPHTDRFRPFSPLPGGNANAARGKVPTDKVRHGGSVHHPVTPDQNTAKAQAAKQNQAHAHREHPNCGAAAGSHPYIKAEWGATHEEDGCSAAFCASLVSGKAILRRHLHRQTNDESSCCFGWAVPSEQMQIWSSSSAGPSGGHLSQERQLPSHTSTDNMIILSWNVCGLNARAWQDNVRTLVTDLRPRSFVCKRLS
jgi:hypothetical protein